jgi:hypothetical protein
MFWTTLGPPGPNHLQLVRMASSGLLRTNTMSLGFCHFFMLYLQAFDQRGIGQKAQPDYRDGLGYLL